MTTMKEEAWRGDVEEQALAEEFYAWLTPMRNELADAEWVRVLGVRRRSSLTDFLRDKKWSQARNQVRKMWLVERTHYLPMSYEEVKAEYDAKQEAEREAKARGGSSTLLAQRQRFTMAMRLMR